MIYLASQSPRRQELLQQLVVPFEVLTVNVHELRQKNESPIDYVRRVAREKTSAGLLQVAAQPGAVVLGADTDVVLDGMVLGKPENAQQAFAMLRTLSGQIHQVISAVCLMSAAREAHCVVSSEVHFASLSDSEVLAYIDTGEPFGKAGAYAIQGQGAAFIRSIQGSYSSIMGLPLRETYQLLMQFQLPIWPKVTS
jgi:septum formation protein